MLQSAVDTMRGRICGHFYNLFRELLPIGTSSTVIAGLQKRVMTQPFKISVFPPPMDSGQEMPSRSPLPGVIVRGSMIFAHISVVSIALAAKESGRGFVCLLPNLRSTGGMPEGGDADVEHHSIISPAEGLHEEGHSLKRVSPEALGKETEAGAPLCQLLLLGPDFQLF